MNEPDNESGVRAYLPPRGPQNVHMVPYSWRDNQGVHSIGGFTIESPENVILTADRDAHRRLAGLNVEELPADDAQQIRDAMVDGDESTIDDVVEKHRPGAATSSDSSTIPDDLESVGYRDLQDLAQQHGINATQSTEELQAALEAVRSGDDVDDQEPEAVESADESESSEYSAYKGSDSE